MAYVGNPKGPTGEEIIDHFPHSFDCGRDEELFDIVWEKQETNERMVAPVSVDENGSPFKTFGPVDGGKIVRYYFDGTTPLRTLRGDILVGDSLLYPWKEGGHWPGYTFTLDERGNSMLKVLPRLPEGVAIYREDRHGHWVRKEGS